MSMEPYGALWPPMELYGAPWSPMEVHGAIWGPMELYGAPWSPMEPCAALCSPMSINIPKTDEKLRSIYRYMPLNITINVDKYANDYQINVDQYTGKCR